MNLMLFGLPFFVGVDQPGFTHGCNYLLPVDITVKIDSDKLVSYGETSTFNKKGIKYRKGIKGDICNTLFIIF